MATSPAVPWNDLSSDVTKRFDLKRRLLSAVSSLTVADRLIQIMKWCRFVGSHQPPMFATREEMYAHIQKREINSSTIDYLEFGVADGESMATWLQLHPSPYSHFWGFDCFEGLPEDWRPDRPKGTFGRGGKPPDITDPRLKFEVGLFQKTLPRFLRDFRPQSRLVIHNDSDLYSATLFTLTQLDPIAAPGTIIIFDDFYDASHEFRALMDYSAAYMRKFRVIAATERFGQVAIILE